MGEAWVCVTWDYPLCYHVVCNGVAGLKRSKFLSMMLHECSKLENVRNHNSVLHQPHVNQIPYTGTCSAVVFHLFRKSQNSLMLAFVYDLSLNPSDSLGEKNEFLSFFALLTAMHEIVKACIVHGWAHIPIYCNLIDPSSSRLFIWTVKICAVLNQCKYWDTGCAIWGINIFPSPSSEARCWLSECSEISEHSREIYQHTLVLTHSCCFIFIKKLWVSHHIP